MVRVQAADLDVLEEIRSCYSLEKRGGLMLTKAVAMARRLGYSWEKIGTAMGVTHQAARQRFKDKV